ncbi:hypothetical protein GCM10010245_61960 [Streptomyces spectabilis]|uniref:Uncharacterized protein n=1 Tax=Streptomyces spectabilis TaxID=68270 RepID=A0A7W8EXZ4_STRST|nr:hypothetical protein [Streptomyces spectabilis]GGV39094.1 hypothetical protein GCM10010245_61960 [Streptomyces spectabilis]
MRERPRRPGGRRGLAKCGEPARYAADELDEVVLDALESEDDDEEEEADFADDVEEDDADEEDVDAGELLDDEPRLSLR